MKTSLYCIGFIFGIGLISSCSSSKKNNIYRSEIFQRHKVHNSNTDSLNTLTVGNGNFALSIDITGLQTFPEYYKNGIPLGTQSDWGWHAFPNSHKYTIEESMKFFDQNEKSVPYAVQTREASRAQKASNYMRQNPHRIHLAQLGWVLNGKNIEMNKLGAIDQTLDPWTGIVTSKFTIENKNVSVQTFASQTEDAIIVQVESELLRNGTLGIELKYPFPTDKFSDEAALYDSDEASRLTILDQSDKSITIHRRLDTTQYYTKIESSSNLNPTIKNSRGFWLTPNVVDHRWAFKFSLSQEVKPLQTLNFEQERAHSVQKMTSYWEKSAIIDFGKTPDPRAFELERRMILSRYLQKVNNSAGNPPQETGLTYNSWYGKPHLEMFWWHALPFALWGNLDIFESQLAWYFKAYDTAKVIAKRQGYEGVRWQKMTDIWGGETASSVGSFLLWQQPHLIYFSEIAYQNNPQKALQKYAFLVEETAAFMSDFLYFNQAKKQYDLGPYIIPSQESYHANKTLNPGFEVAYWKWGLETAQKWRQRAGLQINQKWQDQILNIAPLPDDEKLYWAVQTDTYPYTDPFQLNDHPSVLGSYSIVPEFGLVDKEKMKKTLDVVIETWNWNSSWGWDFPMASMVATRLDNPELAVDLLLMNKTKNTYLKNGHNFQTNRLRLYMPGNGGLLIALARMANKKNGSGFPSDWNVQVEGFKNDL